MTPSRLIRDESGVALVEFALVLPLLLVLVLGIIDFGRAFNHWIDSTHLANVAARYAVVNKNPGAPASLTLQQYIQEQATQQVPAVCIEFQDTTPAVGEWVEVRVTSEWSWLASLVGLIDMLDPTGDFAPTTDIEGHAKMRLEAPPTNYDDGCEPAPPA